MKWKKESEDEYRCAQEGGQGQNECRKINLSPIDPAPGRSYLVAARQQASSGSSDNADLEEVTVTGAAQGPTGETITEKVFSGGVHLVDGLKELNDEHPALAQLAFGAGKALLTGGPIKTVVTKVAELTLDSVVADARMAASNLAQSKTQDFITGLARDNNLSLNLSIAGNNVPLGPDEFGMAAGQVAGGVVDTIFDQGLQKIVARGGYVREIAKGANNPKTRQAAVTGQEAHRQIQVDRANEYIPEQPITLPDGSLVRKDGVGISDPNKVLIIKPDTPTGAASAQRRSDLMKSHGYDTEVQLYDPADPRWQPGSPTYIGPKK